MNSAQVLSQIEVLDVSPVAFNALQDMLRPGVRWTSDQIPGEHFLILAYGVTVGAIRKHEGAYQ